MEADKWINSNTEIKFDVSKTMIYTRHTDKIIKQYESGDAIS